MANKPEAQGQASLPRPPRSEPEPRSGGNFAMSAQQSLSARHFSLDPNVGVAVNLAPDTSNSRLQQHRNYSLRLHTVSEGSTYLMRSSSKGIVSLPPLPVRATLSRCSSQGLAPLPSCGPSLRNELKRSSSDSNVYGTELPHISDETNLDIGSSARRNIRQTHYKSAVVESNEPHTALDYPPLYFIIKNWPWLLEAIKSVYLFRWRMSYPLQKRIPCSKALQKLGIHFTWGELLLVLPFFILLFLGTLYSFLFPSVSVTGKVSRVPLIFCFVTATHNSFLSLLLGMPFSRALWYHKLAGRIAFINGILHTYVAYVYPSDDKDAIPSGLYANVMFGEYLVHNSVNSAGTGIFALITGMLITSLPYIRKRVFELFYYVHIVFAVAITVCAFFHSGVLVPILVIATWGIDLIVRKLIMAATRYPRKACTRIISDTVVELRFPKQSGFDFNPGQYVYICVPLLSLLEWHPFSISSSPGQKIVSLYIRVVGDWTAALHELAQTSDEISIFLEGPFGTIDVDLMTSDRYRTVLLVSGGIGITQMQSICNQLIYEYSMDKRALKTVCFVWVERDANVMSDVDVVRRCTNIHHKNAAAAASVSSILDDDTQLGIASTILALVPDQALNRQLNPESSDERAGEQQTANIPVPSIGVCSPSRQKSALSHLTNDASFMEEGRSEAQFGKRWRDDDTFLGAAYNGTTTRSPTDVMDVRIYLTAKETNLALRDLPFVYSGRPDFDRLFLRMREEALASGESRVAVCVCAQDPIVDACQEACVKFSDSRVCFDFHCDSFK